jgi:hypothetical protein
MQASLQQIDYDAIDWDENLDDEGDREAEARWFEDEDDDEEGPPPPSSDPGDYDY